jgi:hypothetical protein
MKKSKRTSKRRIKRKQTRKKNKNVFLNMNNARAISFINERSIARARGIY